MIHRIAQQVHDGVDQGGEHPAVRQNFLTFYLKHSGAIGKPRGLAYAALKPAGENAHRQHANAQQQFLRFKTELALVEHQVFQRLDLAFQVNKRLVRIGCHFVKLTGEAVEFVITLKLQRIHLFLLNTAGGGGHCGLQL